MGLGMRQLIVFSLDTDTPASESDRTTAISLLRESGIEVREALGVYKGKAERSFIASVTHRGEAALVKSIAIHYNQESILTVDLNTHEASLVFMLDRGRKQILGHWIKTDEINKEAMTIDLTDMQGYVVR